MTLPEYIHDHLIDFDLMSQEEISELIQSIYDQLDRTGYNHKRDAKLIDMLVDLESQFETNELIIPKFTF